MDSAPQAAQKHPFEAVVDQAKAASPALDAAAAIQTPEVKTPKAKIKKEKAPPPTEDGIIFYSDASAKPNPGYGGWGIHGYVYSDQVAKKGSGNTSVFLTSAGYVLKSQVDGKLAEITPLKYIDGFGSHPNWSNNGGEVGAMREAVRVAAQFPVKRVTLYSDSEYAVRGSSYLPTWEANNWCRNDGQPLKNLDYWQGLNEAINHLKSKNVDLSIQWVKGHNEDKDGNFICLGNAITDRYALFGRRVSTAGEADAQVVTALTPEGYWAGIERHPFIHHKCAYFTSNPAYNVAGEYYLGDHGKDAEEIGMRNADTGYAYIVLNTPDPLVETVRQKMLQISRSTDLLAFCLLTKVFEQQCSRDLDRFGVGALYAPHRGRIDLNYADEHKDPILKELTPPRIAAAAFEALNELKGVLLDWQNNPQTLLQLTDITPVIFTTTDKDTYQLSDAFGPGFSVLDVEASYAMDAPPHKALLPIGLVLGVDLPGRNALKRLEAHKPTVLVVTWRAADSVRFATIVKTDDGVGIWSGYYANRVYLKS